MRRVIVFPDSPIRIVLVWLLLNGRTGGVRSSRNVQNQRLAACAKRGNAGGVLWSQHCNVWGLGLQCLPIVLLMPLSFLIEVAE